MGEKSPIFIMMIPDRTFVKDLKTYDKDLSVHWDNRLSRWVIFRKSSKGFYKVLTVQNQDGSYRPLDDRAMLNLYESDLWKIGIEEYERRLDKHNDAVKKEADSRVSDRIRERAEEIYPRFKKVVNEDLGISGHSRIFNNR